MYYNHSSQYWAAQPGLLEQDSLEPRGTLTAKSALQCWQPKKLSKKKSSRSEMWWGVLIGLFGLGAGFFGLRKVFTTDGRITEHNRQKRYAEMLTREIAKKDKATDAQTNQKIQRIRRTTIRRKKKKTAEAARSFLSRTKEEQW